MQKGRPVKAGSHNLHTDHDLNQLSTKIISSLIAVFTFEEVSELHTYTNIRT